jgi:hypothetical protein
MQDCWQAFGRVSEAMYGIPFDLPAIERSVKHLRRDTALNYDDLRLFESPEHWWFAKFWVFPADHQVSPALQRRTFNFWRLKENREEETIRDLLEIFKSIELVSIILRFIKPEHYGILSPPVERVLDVKRGSDAVETYLNYLKDLRRIKAYYRFPRAADADMALWVLHEYCFGTLREQQIRDAYLSDPFMLALRIANRTSDVFQGRLQVAVLRGLLPINVDLAAQLGGVAFERMVRTMAIEAGIVADHSADMSSLIDALREKGVITQLTAGSWHRARRIRNKAIHRDHGTTTEETQWLLKQLE